MPTATVFNSIDLNIVDQWIASSGPKTKPERTRGLCKPRLLITKNNKKTVPRNVRIPTNESGLTSEVLMISGIVPHEIANKLIKKYALSLEFKLTVVLVLSSC